MQEELPIQDWIQQAPLLNLTSEAICVRDLDGRTVYLNRSAEELYGWPFAEAQEKNFQALVDTRFLQESIDLDPILIEEKHWEGELTQTRRNGQQLIVESRQVLIINAQGEPVGFMEVNRDVSERKQVETQLAQANDRFELATAALNGLIFDFDCRTRTVQRTEGIQRLLGYTLQEAEPTADWWSQHIHPEDLPSLDERGAAVLANPTARYFVEYRIRHKDGHYRWVEDVGMILRDDNGAAQRIVGSTTDITERKQLETEREMLLQESQAARAEAETANRTKDEFLAIVSHELRSPLNSILGWAKLLRTRNLDAETTNRALEIIQRNAESQAQLIDDLLDVSRMIRGNLRLEMAPVNLLSVVKDALDTWHPIATSKQIDLKFIVPESSPDSAPLAQSRFLISGDFQRLQQIVLNLISNAIKFTSAGGRVEVILEERRSGEEQNISSAPLPLCPSAPHLHFTQITITDTGKGISADFLPYVFERFQRASTTTHANEGLGLGLAIVRHLVELHGGTVAVTSAGEGQGATFTVRFPLLLEEMRGGGDEEMRGGGVEETPLSDPSPLHPLTSSSPHPLTPSPLLLQNLRILVVDDEADTRDVISMMLRQEGAIALTAASARAARDVFCRFQPMILLSDISMPEEDGYSLITWVRSLSRLEGGTIPAIALTAFARQQDRDRALEEGFHEHIPKPIEPSNLVNTIVRLIQEQNR
jgi:PAS domain S-box-containing protein